MPGSESDERRRVSSHGLTHTANFLARCKLGQGICHGRRGKGERINVFVDCSDRVMRATARVVDARILMYIICAVHADPYRTVA